MREAAEQARMTGSVSNDCAPIARNLRTALTDMVSAFESVAMTQYQKQVVMDARIALANSTHLPR